MSLTNIFKLAGGALNAQTVRLNTIASNLANVETVSGSAQTAYRAKRPVFTAVLENATNELQSGFGVKVKTIAETRALISSCSIRRIPSPTRRATYTARTSIRSRK